MKKYLFLSLIFLSIPSHAFMRKVVGDKLDEKDRAAVNMNFQELEQRLSNKGDMRSLDTFQGYKVGTFTSSASTGNQSITGIGFKPRLVVIGYGQGNANNFFASVGWGTATSSALLFAIAATNGNNTGGRTTVANIIFDISDVDGVSIMQATLVSMDNDGFTLNWSGNPSAVLLTYLAFQ